ncbi:MAG: glycosyltransferase family A protein [Pseudomonadota bacterium]
MTPLLTIGLPVRNGAAYLAAALDSLSAQTFGDFRVVISDNRSTDATPDICRAHALRDPRFIYGRTAANIGAGPNFNRVFGYCTSPYFKWMAHDDLLAPTFLDRCVATLRADPGLVLAHTALTLVDEGGRPLPRSVDGRVFDRQGRRHHDLEPPHLAEDERPSRRFGDALRRMNWCTAVFGVIRADALKRTHLHGSYYEADRVLLAELALLGRFRQLDEPLFLKRCHGGVSVLKSFREQALMIDPAVRPGPPGLRLRLGYARALTVGSVGLAERAACALTVLRVSLRNRLTHRLAARLAWLPPPGRWRPGAS